MSAERESDGALDFSMLDDDQLVALISAACAEAANRSLACRAAAEAAASAEAERARASREAATERARLDAETRRVAELWAYKDRVGAEISEILRPKRAIELKTWQKGLDKRIFIGGGYKDDDCTYYHTGNSYHKPRSIEIVTQDLHLTRPDLASAKERLLPVLVEIAERSDALTIPVPAYERREEAL